MQSNDKSPGARCRDKKKQKKGIGNLSATYGERRRFFFLLLICWSVLNQYAIPHIDSFKPPPGFLFIISPQFIFNISYNTN